MWARPNCDTSTREPLKVQVCVPNPEEMDSSYHVRPTSVQAEEFFEALAYKVYICKGEVLIFSSVYI